MQNLFAVMFTVSEEAERMTDLVEMHGPVSCVLRLSPPPAPLSLRRAVLVDSSARAAHRAELKRQDDMGWMMTSLAEPERSDFLLVREWMAMPESLLEQDMLGGVLPRRGYAYRYQSFMADWRRLRAGQWTTRSPFRSLFHRLGVLWAREAYEADAWDDCLEALWDYQAPSLRTMADYRSALERTSGNLFLALPFRPAGAGMRDAVIALGALDRFFTNLRDLEEHTERGIMWFPEELLEAFEISRSELPTIVKTGNRRVARRSRFNASVFSAAYWPIVQSELG